MPGARLFIRNDDVWKLDGVFRFFFDFAMEHGIPVVYAVIPGKMDKKLVEFLCQAKEKRPHLLDIVQHGWRHRNYSKVKGIKYEFGILRSLKSQQEDIRQGLKKMRLDFGPFFTPAFVPPYHGYDLRTLRVLHEEGFRIFSAGGRAQEAKGKFIDLPAQISFTRYEQGRATIRQASELVASLTRDIHRWALCGIVTHHADFTDIFHRKELMRFFRFIAALKNKRDWRVLLFSEILAKKGKSA